MADRLPVGKPRRRSLSPSPRGRNSVPPSPVAYRNAQPSCLGQGVAGAPSARWRTERQHTAPVSSRVDAARLEERQEFAARQQRLAQVARCPDQLGQRPEPQALGVQAGVRHEMDPQPAAKVGLISEPESGLAKRLAYAPLTIVRGWPKVPKATDGLGKAPGDLVEGEGADRGQRLGPLARKKSAPRRRNCREPQSNAVQINFAVNRFEGFGEAR